MPNENLPDDQIVIPDRLPAVEEILKKSQMMPRPLYGDLKVFKEPIATKNLTELLTVKCT